MAISAGDAVFVFTAETANLDAAFNKVANETAAKLAPATAAVDGLGKAAIEAGNAALTGFGNVGLAAEEMDAAVTAGSAEMEASFILLIGAIDRLNASIGTIPVKTRESVAASTSALDLLEEKFVEVARAGEVSAAGIGGAFTGLGALLGAGLFVGFAAHFLEDTEKAVLELGHLADKTGISIEAIAGLQQATRELGVEFESVQNGLVRFERAQRLAEEGGKAQIQAFHRLGISMKEVRDLTPEELFNRLSGAIQQSADSGVNAASAIALLGKGGAALIPIFKQYGDTLDDVMRKNGQAAGVTDAADRAAEQYAKVTADLSVELRKLAIEVLPIVVKAFEVVPAAFKDAALHLDELIFKVVQFGNDFDIIASLAAGTMGWGDAMKALASQAEIANGSIAALYKTAKTVKDEGDYFGYKELLRSLQTFHAAALDLTAAEIAAAKKAQEEKAKIDKQELYSTVDRLNAQSAKAHEYYENGTIDARQWVDAEVAAADLAYKAHEDYYAKLATLFRNDLNKEAEIAAEKYQFEQKVLAKTSTELADATKKLNEELHKLGTEADTSALKEQDKDLTAAGKAARAYLKSLNDLLISERELDAERKRNTFADEAEAIRRAADQQIITEAEKNKRLKALYDQEQAEELKTLNQKAAAEESIIAKLQARLVEMQRSGDQRQVLEVKTALNEQVAEYNQTSAKILSIKERFKLQSQKLDDDVIKRAEHSWNEFFKELIDGSLRGGNALKAMSSLMENAIGQSVAAAVSGSDSFVGAMEKMLKSTLAALSGEAVVQALKHVALAISDAADPFTAALAPGEFQAAAAWGAVAAVAGVGGAVIPGGGGGSGSGGGSYGGGASRRPVSAASDAGTVGNVGRAPVNTTTIQHFGDGGLISARTLAVVGDAPGGGNSREAILPLDHPDSMAAIARALGPHIGGGAYSSRGETHIHNNFGRGLIVGTPAQVAKVITRAVNKGHAFLRSSDSFRHTPRSQ